MEETPMNLTEERARSGHTGDGVRFVLAFSLALTMTALVLSLVAYAR
jgi:hypothetical protein